MSIFKFKIFSISEMPGISKDKVKSVEAGGRILLPFHMLENYMSSYESLRGRPMIFRLTHKKETVVGVLEFFDNKKNILYAPEWVMKNIEAVNGDCVRLKKTNLKKGTDIVLSPHHDLFFTIQDKVKVLERALVNFPCLKRGDTIPVTHNNFTHELLITSTLPVDEIMINECDINVDFAVRPDEPKPCYEDMMPEEPSSFSGVGKTVNGDTIAPTVVKRKPYTRGSLPDYDYDPFKLVFLRN